MQNIIFENRRISEITAQELIDLIGNQEENLWIDFKKQDYYSDPKDPNKRKLEICKDVTAMANADGGYILIGVDEKNRVAQGFVTISNAANVAKNIYDICLQHINPHIRNLEVEKYQLMWHNTDFELVIIHIPPSELKPHGFLKGGATVFVKRYGDLTREYPVSELHPDLLDRYRPPDRRNSISSQDDPLEQRKVEDLLHLMKLRFDETIAKQPYYRILAVPQELDPEAVDTRSENIHNILRNPPNIRVGGFGVTGILEGNIIPSSEGIKGSNKGGGEIFLLKSGFLEVQCPLVNRYFQWRHEESRFPQPWLFPSVVCEFPVSFLGLVKSIYEASGINSKVFVRQEYHNLAGFMLPGGNPSNPVFPASQDERNVYRHSDSIVSKRTVDSNFVPDRVAYELVKEVYECFGLAPQGIPAFDENGNFILQ